MEGLGVLACFGALSKGTLRRQRVCLKDPTFNSRASAASPPGRPPSPRARPSWWLLPYLSLFSSKRISSYPLRPSNMDALQAAFASGAAFLVGAGLPLLAAAFIENFVHRLVSLVAFCPCALP